MPSSPNQGSNCPVWLRISPAIQRAAHVQTPHTQSKPPRPSVPTHKEELHKFAPRVHSAAAVTRNTEQSWGNVNKSSEFPPTLTVSCSLFIPPSNLIPLFSFMCVSSLTFNVNYSCRWVYRRGVAEGVRWWWEEEGGWHWQREVSAVCAEAMGSDPGRDLLPLLVNTVPQRQQHWTHPDTQLGARCTFGAS